MPAVGNDWSQAQLDATSRTSSSASRKEQAVAARAERPPVSLVVSQGRVSSWLTTVDHKRIGILYIVTSLVFFLAGGMLALLMRAQLATPNEHFVTREQLQRALHDARDDDDLPRRRPDPRPGFGNYLVPLMIGARDMAFPRLNALSYWLFLLGGIILYSSWFAAGGAPQRGLDRLRAALRGAYTPGHGMDLWILSLHVLTLVVARGRDQLPRHDPRHARARDDVDADAAVRLVDRGLRGAARGRAAGALGRA